MENRQKTLFGLFVPISIEILFYMLAGMIDTLMLSSVSDYAVGAVGTANTYISVFIIMFNIISSGMIAVMTQNIGAGRPGVAYQARQLGIAFNLVLGIAMSVFFFIKAGSILMLVGIADALYEPAVTYLSIVGAGCFLNALIPVFSNYIRAFGYAKEPLYATVAANVVNLVLNALFLFVMKWGVAGVAVATVISRVVNFVINIYYAKKLINAKEYTERISNRTVLLQIIKIGLPAALETILYNIAMTLVIRFLNMMDTDGINVTARSYAVQIANFSYCIGAALAEANAIMTGWFIGAREYERCNECTKKAAVIGVAAAVIIEGMFALGGRWIVSFFTSDAQMISLVVKLLAIDIALEMGRVVNLVYGQALKTSGDALFTVVLAAFFMYLCAVGGSYLFGIRLGLCAVGAYIGLAADECFRAVGMVMRWKSGKWKEKKLI